MKYRDCVLTLFALLVVISGGIWLVSAQGVVTVNNFADEPGTCPASCTLRAAIAAVNAGPEDTINFSGPGTIFVNSDGGLGELPAITADGVTIDTGGNQVVLDGSQSPALEPLAYGLLVTSDNNTILGLHIQNFAGDGIVIDGGSGNQIGGTGAGEGNVIHLNGGNGIVLNAAGTQAAPNVIQANLIGTDATGTSVEANGGAGILITNGSEFNQIGGSVSTAANIISGNDGGGIVVDGSQDNVIEGNRIGLDGGTGIIGLGNGDTGVLITNAGGGNQILANTISASAGDGILVLNSTDTIIADNRIGLDAAFGTVALGNSGHGVHIQDSTGINVTGNSIAASGQDGVRIAGSTSSDNTIASNRIGLAADGTTAIGNTGDGVEILMASNNLINGNFIASNAINGVQISGGTANTISNNFIGLNESQAASANDGTGVLITGGASDSEIVDNTIANNGDHGVSVNPGMGITIARNIMYDNGGLGIDLGPPGVTLNDPGDTDTGANDLQNFPVIVSALFDGTTTTIEGTLNSTPNTAFTIELVSNITCDPSDYGEAENLLGVTVGVITNGSGDAVFSVDAAGLASGEFVSALATNDSTGNTSEFAQCVLVETGPPVADFSAAPVSGEAPLTVTFTDESTGVIDTYLWDFGDGNTSADQNPVHTFTAPGTYTVELTVTGPGGTDTATLPIEVTAPATDTAQPTVAQPTDAPPQIVPSTAPAVDVMPTATSPLTATLMVTPSPSATQTPSRTATATATPTFTVTPSLTPTATLTRTPTATLTWTPTATATLTPSRTATLTPTFSVTPSWTPTYTATPLPTLTPSPTMTPDLDVAKTVDDDGFQIVVANVGPTDANNVGLIEALRPGVRYLSSRPGAPVCIEDAGVVYCALGRIASGASAEVDFVVSTDGTDPASGQTIVTSDGVRLVVIDEPYLLKIGEPPVAGPDTIVTYTLRVVNPMDEAALQVQVQDQMPAVLDIVEATATSGTVEVRGQTVTFRQQQLDPGGRVTITVRARIRADDSSNQIVNRACLTSQSNQTASCAEMRFLRAGEIPTTGESPRLRYWLLVGLALAVSCALLLVLRRSIRAPE